MSFTESTSWKTLRSRPRGASAVADIDDRYAPVIALTEIPH
ncbi:hypothetical protein MM1S1540310_1479 [Mycobacteroides abscessus subsp. bolletii 1S-154-0310]|nr:hypothetical protein MM1S1510930_1922 [Mycobacteroides abscessus subsp. bolletii 1S-151-0930]EIU70468.1 hypothetical protein MM1S1520914_2129 [Mycobacteroides abscessus subsp. bolletii 1S-152-0914]EIU77037.1 hypothetical protein MM1S1530915_1472 [Mycobacteroides abscessus subsp. bolletii 1S-153-0915]EIU83822.1 hypothetical protein MM1S1540310_1479 [Mycobacteroides abscessus subsp. bolletii 1S-154-0310]